MILLEGKKQLKITSKKPVVLYGTRNAFRSKSNGHLIEVTISEVSVFQTKCLQFFSMTKISNSLEA